MEHSHVHDHSCTHCACNNPILALLKEELFSEANFSGLSTKTDAAQEEQSVTMMVSGGTIRPMTNGAVDTVPAIGFADGAVVVSGTEKEVRDFMQQNHPGFTSKVLDPKHVLLPGLIEPHVHIVPTALMMGWLELGGFDGQDLRKHYGIPWVTETIRARVPKVIKGNWLLGTGLDPALMPLIENYQESADNNKELITITAGLLDSITDEVPVLILAASMHTLYLNTPALQLVFDKNKDDEKFRLKYPTFEKYCEKTNGQLQEAAGMDPAMKTLPKDQIAAMFVESFGHLKTLFATANERGVTFMYDAGMNKPLKKVLDAYLAVHRPVVRIGAAQICGSVEDANELPDYARPAEYADVYIGNIKVVSDGSNQGLTAYQSEPYLCNPADNYGIFNYGEEKKPQQAPAEYKKMVETVITAKGWPMMIHANGNLAVQFAIEVYKDYIPNQKGMGLRHRIEHCSLITQEELDTMKELGVSPSFLIGHVGYWGYAFKEAIFGKKTEMLDLCHSALKKGMRITLHSDHQVSPLGPLRMMEQSITRIMEADKDSNVLNAPECITAEQALTAITYDAAWQCNAEQWTGSLVTGNFADFVVLEQDPLTMKDPHMNMRNIGVLETWVAGKLVYGNIK